MVGEEERSSPQARFVLGCEAEDCGGPEGEVGEAEEDGLDSRLPLGVILTSLLEPP